MIAIYKKEIEYLQQQLVHEPMEANRILPRNFIQSLYKLIFALERPELDVIWDYDGDPFLEENDYILFLLWCPL